MTTIWDDVTQAKEYVSAVHKMAERDNPDSYYAIKLGQAAELLEQALTKLGDPDQLFVSKSEPDEQPERVSLRDLSPEKVEELLILGTGMGRVEREAEQWSQAYPQLGMTTSRWKIASYLLYKHLGFEPNGPASRWVTLVSNLTEMVSEELAVFEYAVKQAADARKSDGLTLPGPMSISSWLKDAHAKATSGELDLGLGGPKRIKL